MHAMNWKKLALALALVSGASLAACASGGSAAPVDTTTEEDFEFDHLGHAERMQYMKKVVTPAMAKEFKAFDAEEFGSFNCRTCHDKGNFEMPSKHLPALAISDFAHIKEEHPKMMKFMSETVVPKMAKLLGEEPYNPETGEGFGCFDCHSKKQ